MKKYGIKKLRRMLAVTLALLLVMAVGTASAGSVYVDANDESMGSVNPKGELVNSDGFSSSFQVDDTVTLQATPNEGFALAEWKIGHGAGTFSPDVDDPNKSVFTIKGFEDEGIYICAVFDYAAPERTLTVDCPTTVERGQQITITATLEYSEDDMGNYDTEKILFLGCAAFNMKQEDYNPETVGHKTVLTQTVTVAPNPDEGCWIRFTAGYGYPRPSEKVIDFQVVEGHQLTATEAKDPTCTEAGHVAGYTCSVCGKYFRDEAGEDEIEEAEWVIPATGHKITATEAKAATCTEDGNIAGYTCSVCGKHFKDEAAETEISDADWVVKATGHTEVKDAAVEPTEEKTGLTEGSHCSVCGAVLKAQEEIPKLEKEEDKEEEPEKESEPHKHTEVKDEAVEPTCAANGLTEGSHCSDCDEVIVAQKTIPALGHWLGNWNPDDAGHHTAKCQRQGCTYADTFDCSLVDLPGEEGKDPVHFCPICGYCDGAEDGVRVEGLEILEGEAKGSLCAFTVEPDGEHKYLVIAFDHYGHLMQQEGEITFAVPEELSEAGFVQADEDGLVTLTIDFTPEEELPILFMILEV